MPCATLFALEGSVAAAAAGENLEDDAHAQRRQTPSTLEFTDLYPAAPAFVPRLALSRDRECNTQRLLSRRPTLRSRPHAPLTPTLTTLLEFPSFFSSRLARGAVNERKYGCGEASVACAWARGRAYSRLNIRRVSMKSLSEQLASKRRRVRPRDPPTRLLFAVVGIKVHPATRPRRGRESAQIGPAKGRRRRRSWT